MRNVFITRENSFRSCLQLNWKIFDNIFEICMKRCMKRWYQFRGWKPDCDHSTHQRSCVSIFIEIYGLLRNQLSKFFIFEFRKKRSFRTLQTEKWKSGEVSTKNLAQKWKFDKMEKQPRIFGKILQKWNSILSRMYCNSAKQLWIQWIKKPASLWIPSFPTNSLCYGDALSNGQHKLQNFCIRFLKFWTNFV